MRFATIRVNGVDHTATTRLLTLLLAALAAVLAGRPDDSKMFAVLAVYGALTILHWQFFRRAPSRLVSYSFATLDVGFVSGVIYLLPASSLPLWLLYVLPIAGAATIGAGTSIISTILSIVAIFAVSYVNGVVLAGENLWSAAILASATYPLTVANARRAAERRESRFLEELAAVARRIHAETGDPERVAKLIVQQSRLLVRAKQAGLWWCDGQGQVQPGPAIGWGDRQFAIAKSIASWLLWEACRNKSGCVPFDEPLFQLAGEALALQHEGSPIALLLVAWDRSPFDRLARRERLRIFGRWIAGSLKQAQLRSAAQRELHLEGALRQVVGELAAITHSEDARQIVVNAVRSSLGVPGDLVERTGGRLAGADSESAGPATGSAADDAAPIIVNVDDHLALLLQGARVEAIDREWLEKLAQVTRSALSRCAEHEHLAQEAQTLLFGLDAIPEPYALWSNAGEIVRASDSYHALGLPDALSLKDLNGTGKEITVGDPPRIFIPMVVPLKDGQGTIALLREITRERDALRAKDQLIATVGHELRSPLTSIFGYSQMMARQIGIVQRQIGELNHLIGDFMDAAQVEDAHLPLKREIVNLAQLVRTAGERFRGAHQGRALRLELEDGLVEGDPGRLGQILDNLLGNAVKYSPADSEIRLSVSGQGGEVVVSVRDEGIGIAAAHIPNLFQRFYREPRDDVKMPRGLGLGLSIVRDLVTAHGGRVWAESAGLLKGATFNVALPAAQPSPGEARESLAAAAR